MDSITDTADALDVDAFAYVVSHDLRAPLRAVHLFARYLEERLGDRLSQEERGWFDVVRDELRRLDGRLEGVRGLAEAGVATGPPCLDTSSVVREAWAAAGAEGHHLLVDGDLPALRLPRVQASAVLRALFRNAALHHRGAGSVTVRGGADGVDGGTWLEVEDDGPGFPRPLCDLARPFPPRSSVPEGAGPGLGLALCAHLLAHHGGRLEAGRPRSGSGACVRLVWPR